MTENSESVAASDGLWLDARLWGKSAELPRPYPVVCHLLDTVAVAGALWDQMVSPRSRARIAAELGLSVAEGRQMVCFWAGLHDIGKISPPFQALDKAAFAGVAGDPATEKAPGGRSPDRPCATRR